MSVTVIAPEPSGEVPALSGDAVLTADAAVAIAEIEADRDVKLATLTNETIEAVAEIEAAEDDEIEDLEWLNSRLDALEASLASRVETVTAPLMELLTQVSAMLTSLLILIPSPPMEPETMEPATEPENPDAAEEGPQEQQDERPRRRFRALL